MAKFLTYFSVLLFLMANNVFANNSDMIKMSQPHPLTLDDVEFDVSTGTIEKYKADYENIVIPDNFDGTAVTSIGDWAFYGNALTSVTIPNSVTSIEKRAFYGNALASVTIPNSVTSIGEASFAGNALTSVTIPNSVTSIGKLAFGLNALTSVTIPNSVTSIGEAAFNDNKIVMVNDSVSHGFIYGRNDDGTDNIKKIISYGGESKDVTIPKSVTSIGDWTFSGNALMSVIISNSVTYIGDWAFSGNDLTIVTIPNSVTSIGEFAFYGNALMGVTIPNSVTSIGDRAFDGVVKITRL